MYVFEQQVLGRPQQLSQQGCALEVAIEAATLAIINLKDTLNDWDSKVGDGDCGSTVSRSNYIKIVCILAHYY